MRVIPILYWFIISSIIKKRLLPFFSSRRALVALLSEATLKNFQVEKFNLSFFGSRCFGNGWTKNTFVYKGASFFMFDVWFTFFFFFRYENKLNLSELCHIGTVDLTIKIIIEDSLSIFSFWSITYIETKTFSLKIKVIISGLYLKKLNSLVYLHVK